jgi:hypothetical protein
LGFIGVFKMPRLGPKKTGQTRSWFYRNVFLNKDLLDVIVSSDFDQSWLDNIPIKWYPTWACERSTDKDAFKLYVTCYAREMVDHFSLSSSGVCF